MTRRRAALVETANSAPRLLRMVSYRRASTDELNQPYSLDAQQARVAGTLGSRPEWEHVGDYVERASGKDISGRPQLKKLLRDAAAGKFDVVLVARIDRLSRSLSDLLHIVEHLTTYDVAFASATEHFDTTTPMGKMTLQILGTFAEFERSLIIDRIIRGNAAKIAQGRPLTSKVGFGLRLDADGRIEADPASIGIVRRLFAEYTTTEAGTKAIANALNDDHVAGPGGKAWSADAVSRLLRNRAFVGELWHQDRWHLGAHKPVIDVTQFELAQTIADSRMDSRAAATRRGDFVLSGNVTCALCGSAYVGTSGTGRSGQVHRYYSCGTAKRYKAARCEAQTLPAEEFEELITEALLACYTDSALFTQAIEAYLAQVANRREPLAQELTAAQAALAAKERVRRKYQADYEADKLSAELYQERVNELEPELYALGERVTDLELRLEVGDLPTVPTEAELAELHERLTTGVRRGSITVRKALFSALIEDIAVHAPDDIRPTFRLYDTAATQMLTVVGQEAAGQEPDGSGDGLRFASRRLGWS